MTTHETYLELISKTQEIYKLLSLNINCGHCFTEETDHGVLGTVHQHLFHAVVCSDFILPDTHCTVHWIIQETDRIG